MTECGATVYWWDGEYEGGCELLKGHVPDDIHYDGLSWYNDQNEEISEPDEDVRRQLGAQAKTNDDDAGGAA